jgi:hypothetical protein
MDHAVLRPYAAAGVALVGASLIAVIPAIAPKLSNIHAQSPAVELTSGADAFLDLANALDPSASTDGLIGVANNLDSFLDLFGTPTVNVADTLATDFIGYLDVGSSVNSIPGLISTLDSDLTADIIALDQDLDGYITGLHTAITDLDSDLGTGLGLLNTDLVNGFDTINASIGSLTAELNNGIFGLETDLSTDLGPLTTIVTELGPEGGIVPLLSLAVEYLEDISIAE